MLCTAPAGSAAPGDGAGRAKGSVLGQGTAGIKKANSKFTFPPSQGIAKEPPYLGSESPAQLDAAQLAKGGEDNSHLPVSQQQGCTSPAWGKAGEDLAAWTHRLQGPFALLCRVAKPLGLLLGDVSLPEQRAACSHGQAGRH